MEGGGFYNRNVAAGGLGSDWGCLVEEDAAVDVADLLEGQPSGGFRKK